MDPLPWQVWPQLCGSSYTAEAAGRRPVRSLEGIWERRFRRHLLSAGCWQVPASWQEYAEGLGQGTWQGGLTCMGISGSPPLLFRVASQPIC